MSTESGVPPASGPGEEALIQALDQAAELERVIVAEARAGKPSAEELRAVETARQRAQERSVSRRRSPIRLVAAGLVAAGLLVAAMVVWRSFGRDAGPPPGVTLGGNQVEILAPRGAVEAFTVLRWRTTTQGSPRFSVRVVDPATGAVLLREPDLQAVELSLDHHDTSAWKSIQVEIDELDSAGDPVKSGRERAWRRSP